MLDECVNSYLHYTNVEQKELALSKKGFSKEFKAFLVPQIEEGKRRFSETCFVEQLTQSKVYLKTNDFEAQLVPGMSTCELKRRIEMGNLKAKKEAQRLGIARTRVTQPWKYARPSKATLDLLKTLKNGLDLKKTKTFLAQELGISRKSLNNYIKKFKLLGDLNC